MSADEELGPWPDLDTARLFPSFVSFVEATAEMRHAKLPPEEEATIASSVLTRQGDFRAGRTAARCALARLGLHDAVLQQLPSRSPRWPPGYVGTISHCLGYCAAAAARASDLAGIGLDAERRAAVRPEIARRICTPAELAWIEREQLGLEAPTVIFSAKEAIFKCLNPLSGVFFGFQDAEVTLSPELGVFSATIRDEAGQPCSQVSGRFGLTSGHVLVAAVLRPDDVAPGGPPAIRTSADRPVDHTASGPAPWPVRA